MIALELDARDIDRIVAAAHAVTGEDALGKLSGFILTDDGLLSFEQSFVLGTTVRIGLSCDDSGRLLIEIVRLASNRIGNGLLRIAQGSIVGILESATRGVLAKESAVVLSFSPQRVLPIPLKFRSVEIRDNRLFVQAELD